MENIMQLLCWLIFLTFLLVHVALLILKKQEAILYAAKIMAGFGILSMVVGLIYFIDLGIYGVLVMLVGSVIYVSAKDHMEKG